MRPALRVHLPLRLLLDPVVSDRGRRVEAGVDVVLGQLLDQPGLDSVGGPDPGVAVSLELSPNRPALGALAVVADLLEDAKLVLDVMSVLVGDDVRLCERRAAGAEARLQLVEEPEVDVDLLIPWAVERPDLGAGEATPRLHLVGEEDRVGVRVLPAAPFEDTVPELLDAVDDGDDPAVLPLVRVLARPALLGNLTRGVALPDLLVLERSELAEPAAAGQDCDQQVDDEHGQADSAAADSEPAGAGQAAASDVGYLVWIEACSSSKAHPASLPPEWKNATGPRRRLAAAAFMPTPSFAGRRRSSRRARCDKAHRDSAPHRTRGRP